VSYAGRRRASTLAGAAAAASLTALSAWALGGHAPNPVTEGSTATAPDRTVTRSVVVRRRVSAPAAAARTVAAPAAGATPALASPAAPGATPTPRHRRMSGQRKTPSRRPAAGAPATGAEPLPGGYRAFASATAAMAGDLVLARAGSAAALDGHPPDTADDLGALVADLPAARTAFGRAVALPGDAAATSSSPPAGPAAGQDTGRGMTATTTARTDPRGACVRGAPISSAEAHAATAAAGPFALAGARSRTESSLDAGISHWALVSRALAAPPEVSIAAGTASEVAVRFLGPVTLLVRAGGTAGSAAAQLDPPGDAAAPLVDVRAAGRTVRYTAADVLEGGGRTLRFGAVTVVLGGAPHAWRRDAGSPPLVGADGTFASAAADLLTVRIADAPALVLGHLEAAVAVPARGVRC